MQQENAPGLAGAFSYRRGRREGPRRSVAARGSRLAKKTPRRTGAL